MSNQGYYGGGGPQYPQQRCVVKAEAWNADFCIVGSGCAKGPFSYGGGGGGYGQQGGYPPQQQQGYYQQGPPVCSPDIYNITFRYLDYHCWKFQRSSLRKPLTSHKSIRHHAWQ